MNIDELTLGQIKQIQAMANGASTPAQKIPSTGRYVLVVDRGWIFAGNIGTTADGYISLKEAVHVFRWESIGFAKMLTDWKSDKVDIRPCEDVELPADAVIFRVPVPGNWGIK